MDVACAESRRMNSTTGWICVNNMTYRLWCALNTRGGSDAGCDENSIIRISIVERCLWYSTREMINLCNFDQ